MSIARMKKLSVIGLISNREELIEKLMTLGVVEITDQERKLDDSKWREIVEADADEQTASAYDARMAKASLALETIDKYGTAKKPILRTRIQVAFESFRKVTKNEQQIEERVDLINSLSARHLELTTAINKAVAVKLSLLPWIECDIPVEMQGTKTTDLIMGVAPVIMDVALFKKELKEKVPDSFVELVSSDTEQDYLYVLCLKSERDAADDVFRDHGFSKVYFGDLTGTAKQNIASLDKRVAELSEEKYRIEDAIRSHEAGKQEIQFLYDSLVVQRDRAAIRQNLLITQKTFYLDGWLPARAEDKVSGLLTEMGCYFSMEDPDRDEETPVLLLNGNLSMPFEAITKLYALPYSRAIDATPFFSLSFIVFFGMMLGDAAYGIIICIITGLLLKKFNLEGMKYQMIKLFFYCGIGTIFWGAMFGGWFGDIVTVVGKTFFNVDVAIPPLWFNPMEDPMKLLVFCFLLGGIHLFLGMALNAWLCIKDGRPLDALFDVGFWYILLIALTLLFVGIAPELSKWLALLSALGIFLTAGRDRRGLSKIVGGLSSLYGVTGYLSDLLSYSRLLALGLASGVIASVVNVIGSLGGGGIVGAILMTIAFVIGHTYNFAVNGLGSFVHSCRLEYVEFFGKFYQSGGEAFRPFRENTKYVDIIREEI